MILICNVHLLVEKHRYLLLELLKGIEFSVDLATIKISYIPFLSVFTIWFFSSALELKQSCCFIYRL